MIYIIIIGGKKKKKRVVAGSLLVRKRVGFFVCILLLKGKYLLQCTITKILVMVLVLFFACKF